MGFLGINTDDDERTPRKPFAQRDRMKVWDKEFGASVDRSKCPICGMNEISRFNFTVGHRKSLKNGGTNNMRNLRPICQQCNSQMGSMNMSVYIKKYQSNPTPTPVKKPKKPTKKPKEKEESGFGGGLFGGSGHLPGDNIPSFLGGPPRRRK